MYSNILLIGKLYVALSNKNNTLDSFWADFRVTWTTRHTKKGNKNNVTNDKHGCFNNVTLVCMICERRRRGWGVAREILLHNRKGIRGTTCVDVRSRTSTILLKLIGPDTHEIYFLQRSGKNKWWGRKFPRRRCKHGRKEIISVQRRKTRIYLNNLLYCCLFSHLIE